MTLELDRLLRVPAAEAVRALSDLRFLAECLPGDWTANDDLLRGACEIGDPESRAAEFDLSVRLIDLDSDEGALKLEAMAREVTGQGRVVVTVDVKVMSGGPSASDLVMTPYLRIGGLADADAYARMEDAALSSLGSFSERVAARLDRGDAHVWVSPGSEPTATAAGGSAGPMPIARRPVVPLVVASSLAAIGLAGVLGWRALRSRASGQ